MHELKCHTEPQECKKKKCHWKLNICIYNAYRSGKFHKQAEKILIKLYFQNYHNPYDFSRRKITCVSFNQHFHDISSGLKPRSLKIMNSTVNRPVCQRLVVRNPETTLLLFKDCMIM